MDLGTRILNFFNFCHNHGFEYGICFHENEWHVTVTNHGNIYCYGQQATLTAALDECASGFQKVGLS